MRLLLVLNENPIQSEKHIYAALEELAEQGLIESFHVYSFLAKLVEGYHSDEIVDEIIKLSREFEPTAVLWSHTDGLKVHSHQLEELKNISSKPVMGYWDGDMYQNFYKPLPQEIIILSEKCDVSFWPGCNSAIRSLKKYCLDIRYVPLTTDKTRFCEMKRNDMKYDVVMLGTFIKSKIPFKTYPGSAYRKKMADFLYKKLGNRFAIFGHGWNKKYSPGITSFSDQKNIYYSSRLAVGMNNLFAEYYFGNRLPVCMSCGVNMIHNYEEGIEQIFGNLKSPIFFRSIEEAWDIIQNLLSKDQNELDDLAIPAYDYALKKLDKTSIFQYMIQVMSDYIHLKKNKKNLYERKNPWIPLIRF